MDSSALWQKVAVHKRSAASPESNAGTALYISIRFYLIIIMIN